MSKMVSKFALAAGLVLAMALTLSCSEAQAADNEKRIIGTWAIVKADGSDEDDKLVFNSDGTGTFGKYGTGRYAVVASKLAFVFKPPYGDDITWVNDLFISTDGKTAIISGDKNAILRKKN
jgi:hypothetical protein